MENSYEIDHRECRELVLKMSKDLYGNGKPGLMQEMQKMNTAIIGDLEHDGALTILRRLEEKPRDRMLQVKDFFYITLAVISIAGALIKYLGA